MKTATSLMTAEEFFDWVNRPENGGKVYELERGEVVEMPRPGERHGVVCVNVGYVLSTYIRQRGKGYACGNDTGIIWERDPDTVRGVIASRMSIRNGVAVGTSERPTDTGLSGALRIANQVIHGSIMISIAGVIMPCASLRSEHAAPIVMKMAPNMKLSNHGEVIVGARVSRSGSPMPASGDYEGLSAPVKLGAAGVALTIDKRIP